MRLKKLLFSPRACNRVGQQQPQGGIFLSHVREDLGTRLIQYSPLTVH